MNNYGATVKELRKSKGLLLKELVDEQLSMSLLSQFENGKTTISCERFHRLLDKLEVSFAEFQLLHTGEHHSEAQKLMVAYVRSMGIESIDEVPKLKKKYQKLTAYFQRHYSLELDHFLQLIRFDYLMKEELFKGVPIQEAYPKHNYCLDSAKHYLLNTDTWGVYELRLFARVAVSMEPALLWRCLTIAIKKSQRFAKIPGNKDILYNTFETVFSVFAVFDEVDYAEKTFHLWRDHVYEKEHIEQAIFMPFFEGWTCLLKQNKPKAADLMQQTLDQLERLGMKTAFSMYQSLSTFVLKEDFPGILLSDPLLSEGTRYGWEEP